LVIFMSSAVEANRAIEERGSIDALDAATAGLPVLFRTAFNNTALLSRVWAVGFVSTCTRWCCDSIVARRSD